MTSTTVNRARSSQLFQEAKKVLVGGVNSPVRAFKAVGGDPVFFKRGEGSHLYDEDGNEYVDYLMSWGPLLFGHSPKEVVAAISAAAKEGTSFGAPTAREAELAKLVQEFLPSCELIRLVNSGVEATTSAIRLARGATGRRKIMKFNGCYHGHSDSLLVKAGSGGLTLGIPDSKGIINELASQTISIEFNDLQELEQAFNTFGTDLAAVIIEPVVGNMGVVVPKLEFLKSLEHLCRKQGTLLIFDEVMTGFRVHPGGAQALYGIKPDLTCFGKVIGGGLPCGAYGGRRDLMELIAPMGPVYQAGTLSGNPVVTAAGMAMLTRLKKNPHEFKKAVDYTEQLAKGVEQIAREKNYPLTVNRVGTMFTIFHNAGPVNNLKEVMYSDVNKFKAFYHAMLDQGIYFAPSQYEANFTSAVHTEADLQKTLAAVKKAL